MFFFVFKMGAIMARFYTDGGDTHTFGQTMLTIGKYRCYIFRIVH